MDIVTALALSIGLLGGVATYLYLSDPLGLGLQIWAAFIAWASFYHCGGKIQGFIASVLANLWGVVMATLTLLAISRLGFAEQLGLPVWAGICVAIGVGADDPRRQHPDLLGDPGDGLRLRRHCRAGAAHHRRVAQSDGAVASPTRQ